MSKLLTRHRLSVLVVVLAASVAGVAGVASGRAAGPPATVMGAKMASTDKAPFRKRGSTVKAAHLGVRSFLNSKDGFALADVGGAQYPANTTDGGHVWRIDGPHFHVNAADAPDVVNDTGAARTHTYFAYAGPGGGYSVCVSTDGGTTWWRTYFGGIPIALLDQGGTLIVIEETGAPHFLIYESTDGGQVWHHITHFV